MIEILGNQISVEGFEDLNFDPTSSPNFSFLLREEIGLSLPICNISFNTDLIEVQHKLGNNRKFTLKLNDEDYDFVTAKVTAGQSSYNLQGISDNIDFLNKSKQFSDEGTVIDIINKSEFITVDSDNLVSDDSQVWINYNQPERNFIRSMLEHSYINDSDFIIYAMKSKDVLLLRSYNKLIAGKPKWDFGTTLLSKYRVSNIEFETIPVYQYQMLVNKTGVETAPGFNNNYNSNYKSETSSMIMIDAGNCYDKYFSSSISNMSNYGKLYEKLYNLTFPNYIGVKPLDTLIIRQADTYGDDMDSELISESMIVLRVDTSFKNGSISQQIYFARINDSE